MDNRKTTDIWAAAHKALCAGRWSEARARLDDLSRRNDNPDCLAGIDFYETLNPGKPLAEEYRPLLADRIGLVNAKVSTR